MSIPTPRPGLVICYSYLWATEHGKGIKEGRKNRPCAIVAARQIIEGREVVTVVSHHAYAAGQSRGRH